MEERRSLVARFAVILILGLALAGCSLFEDDAVDVAGAHEQFCADVADYVELIGQYGGLFDGVELTVGDVKSASDELEPGREAVIESAEAFETAVAADPVAGVEFDVVEQESIDRVQDAEAAFARAGDIEDRTRVVDAGVRFTSAAYQLEVAWVLLFADAGCLEGDQEAQAEATRWVSDYVSAIQTDFRAIGYYRGDIDGVYGSMTIEAVEQFQQDQGLPVTGLVDPATQTALQVALGARQSAEVGGLQAILITTGHYSGPVDGVWTPAVEEALKALQEDLGVPATGVVDSATLRALEEALVAAGEAPSPPSTDTTVPSAPDTTAPADTTTTTVAPEATTTTAAPTPPSTEAPSDGLLQVLADAGQFARFLEAVEAAGMTDALSGSGPITVFAPTDEAFEAAGELPSDPEALVDLISYHLVEDLVTGFDLQTVETLPTSQGGEISVGVTQGTIVLDETATVTVTNVEGSNGVAHIVNAVLVPAE
jgi:peptidoglycan hydrolase-like protein with peptidoglycan-binding domain